MNECETETKDVDSQLESALIYFGRVNQTKTIPTKLANFEHHRIRPVQRASDSVHL